MTDQKPTYEAARDELVDVVRRLESGGASLAESMELWQRGEKLAEICQGYLDGAKEQVAKARRAVE
ncbi:exodeoxyribonuclease VII small subunit [Tessaracoccus sp. MC1679]|uniref:exodeoxyribonuclease VII small subunit n=1 Tax=unclassified Tessaracoccus TaxID=2635419 RepID=UPI0016023C43|nr:exodeoxyribonuclease VII small subunit [Tessaracoccus sp. MC1627]MBB1514400.1 exodeoxyribonuclease VII small subunit [Tessaracoccus sp. MC1679]HSO68402.1 exodeoxyribonuclease VII small subunit [Arachnia sp.]